MAASDGIENPNGNAAAPADKSSSRAWLAVAGLAAAIGASSCCVLPLVLFALGVSGAIENPQLPPITVVTPWSGEGERVGSQKAWAS